MEKKKPQTKGWHMKNITFDDMMVASFRKDPGYAAALLDEMIENGTARELLILLRQVCKAFGGVHALADKVSPQEKPHAETLDAVLHTMGLRLAVQPFPATTATT